MTIKYVTAKDTAGLEKIQDNAIRSVGRARDLVQIALVATVCHIGQHGDYTCATRLVEGLGNTVNGAAVVEWFKRFGKLATDDTGFTGLSKGFKESILGTLDEAKATYWWTLKASNPFKGYSAEAALQQFIKNHKSITTKLMTMPAEDAAKVDVHVNSATIQQVLALCNFDAIIDAELVTAEHNMSTVAVK